MAEEPIIGHSSCHKIPLLSHFRKESDMTNDLKKAVILAKEDEKLEGE